MTGVQTCALPISECVEGAIVCELDANWQHKSGTEQRIEADVICLAVGLSPLTDMLWQADCEMVFVSELGGNVAYRDANMCTSKPHIYIAGDVAGVEEASSAMVEGELAGLCAAQALGISGDHIALQLASARAQLEELRSGPVGQKIRAGLLQAHR